MEEHRCALIIFHDKKKILLQDRRLISKRGEEWGFFGGHIEKGETPEQALIRETKEELSYQLKNYKLFKEIKLQPHLNVKVHYYVYLAPMPPFSDLKQLEGHDMKLFTIKEAKKLKMVKGDDIVLDDLEKYFNQTINAKAAPTKLML
jgi:mutator protein MutT